MKRKFLAIFMMLTMCLALCACGGGTAATITDNDGNTVQMTAKELKEIHKENEAKFNDLYQGADIELTDTVESVSTDTVELKGGWEVQLSTSRDEKSRTFSSNSKRSYILRTSSRSKRLILSSIVSFAVWLKCTRTI